MKKTDCQKKMIGLMREWGLQFPSWRLIFFNHVRRLGYCTHEGKTGGVIGLNEFYITKNSEALVMDTCKHEIAHALAGPDHGHNEVWREWARKVGCVPEACHRHKIVMPPARWSATCESCGRVFKWARRPKYYNMGNVYSCVCDTFLTVVDGGPLCVASPC